MINDQYFPHDATAANNLKLMALIQEEGAKGYGVYWFLIEFLRQQNGYRGQLKMLDMLARRIKTTRVVVERIITHYALFAVEDDCFFSPGLNERMRPLDDKRAAKSDQCRRAAETKWMKIRQQPPACAVQEEERKEEERKIDDEGGHSSIKAPPEYAFNKKTHNLEGLLQQLARLKINDSQEVNAILKLSDYGKLGNTIWQLLYHTQWGKIKTPGKFLIAGLKS
ncbi:Lin1244/Lin1753 domain-containing protein [Bacteroides sp. 224]|uniref:Lin1244/Lin1753 domain-containing protein n=1 Tax=Bacteroides sp. 224 TaxID=2302936 RepID=UPI0013D1598F|nr:Lin1244/Lin1753 domain-containing protein [Bacteroides sp. 224]NDV66430.1 DUF4373 domain-containing protein [Bacteroides sp. 224]